MRIKDKLSKVKYWFYYRFHPSHRYNVVKTGLRPGYYDKDYLMLHACFSLLKDYVEHELAWMALICSDEERAKVSWWQTMEQYKRKHLDRLVMGYLTYWDNITEQKAMDDWCMGKEVLEHTRNSDKEIRELYYWWVNERPNRTDPYDDGKRGMDLLAVDEAYNKQDEEMLIRLMKIRLHLWT